MAGWFLRGLRRGVVTTRYPAREEPSTRLLPSPPAFHADRLTDAVVDALVATCPSGALTRDGRSLRYDVGACTACGRCAAVGGGAVQPSGLIELAATARGQLVKHIPIRGGR